MVRRILDFWFGPPEAPFSGEQGQQVWFRGGEALDKQIRVQFGDLVAAAVAGDFDAWCETPDGRMALILLVDQFTRNLYRGTAAAFSGDARARQLVNEGLERGDDQALPPLQRLFFYLPLEHSETLADQDRCVSLTEALADGVGDDQKSLFTGFVTYAEKHRELIRQFGRFPHRNKALGREATEAERTFLEGGGARFGQ